MSIDPDSPPPRRPLPPRPASGRPAVGPGSVPGPIWLLVGICAAIELALTAADNGLIGAPDWRQWAVAYGGFHTPLISGSWAPLFEGQRWTMFLTHAFLHGDLMHMVMNMVVVLALGKLLSGIIGPWRTVATFLVTAVGGGAVFALLNTSGAPMVGASGAAFGFIGVWKYAEWYGRRQAGAPLQPLLASLGALVIANVAIWFYLEGLLAWEAHLGGFVTGWAMGWMWRITAPDAGRPAAPPA
ncbi:rhomboid family intramembrane serine protease [Paroceanicella profunda]|uniref:Rhomboid family intramembrane serine protease n=1 Tax=Paroceanicella profunda TaxID=2579971 RepID=A0A5B8FY98_9RHOB|nr:rhomboid family intramembrane serine protease [Paroceanicella profunda]QDL93495.1 rhomboid family intramembrane serine protease [Paroceanicella profunda]